MHCEGEQSIPYVGTIPFCVNRLETSLILVRDRVGLVMTDGKGEKCLVLR